VSYRFGTGGRRDARVRLAAVIPSLSMELMPPLGDRPSNCRVAVVLRRYSAPVSCDCEVLALHQQ